MAEGHVSDRKPEEDQAECSWIQDRDEIEVLYRQRVDQYGKPMGQMRRMMEGEFSQADSHNTSQPVDSKEIEFYDVKTKKSLTRKKRQAIKDGKLAFYKKEDMTEWSKGMNLNVIERKELTNLEDLCAVVKTRRPRPKPKPLSVSKKMKSTAIIYLAEPGVSRENRM